VLIFILLLLVISVTAVFDAGIAQAASEVKTINPVADSYVVDEFPDWNRGTSPELVVVHRTGTFSSENIAFLMFDLSGVPSDARVEWAKLRLYAKDVFVSAPLSLHYCPDNGWTEDGITYNNKPAFSPAAIDTVNVTVSDTWYEWNVTATVKSTLTAADKRVSLVLKAETNGSATFYSRSNTDAPPQLVVSYSTTPPTSIDPILVGIVAVAASGLAAGLAVTFIRLRRKNLKHLFHVKVDSSLILALVLNLQELYLADFVRVLNVRSTVSLQVYAGDFHDA
jgi:hypothetical protein